MSDVSPPAFESLEQRVLFAATWLYGVDSGNSDGSSNLFRIDPLTGATVDVGEIGFKIRDIAFTPDGQLWGITNTRLINIDREFGFGSDVGAVDFGGDDGGEDEDPPALNALTSDAGGRLFAGTTDGRLIRFEPREFPTFPPQPIRANEQGEYGRDFLSSGDLAFDTDGTLYATGNREGRVSFLLRLNARTGRSFPVTNVPVLGRAAEGLAFGPDNLLYTVVRGNEANPAILRTNLATGASGQIAVINNPDGITGLAASPIGTTPIAWLLEQVQNASDQTVAQLYNAGVKYAGFISATLANGAGADIYIDLADYYSSVNNRDVSREGDGDWITVWVDKHDPVKGSAMPFTLGAVPLKFQGAATDPTGQFQYGRLSRDYPFRRDPLVEITSVRVEGNANDVPGLDGSARAITGSRLYQTGPDDPRLHLARVEIRRQTLDALLSQAAANIFNANSPAGIAEAARILGETLLVQDGDSVAFNYAQFAPWQIRTFTPTDTGVTPGPGPNNAFDLGTVAAGSGTQRYGVGWVGAGTQSNYFSFTVTGTGPIQINLPRLDGNVSLFLENPAGNVVAFSAKPGTQEESITRTLTPGTYFVRVQSANPYDAGFSVRVAAVDPAAGPSIASLLASQERAAAGPGGAADELDLLGGKALANL